MMMVYKLTSIPDISLVKYKIMSGNGIDVLREWTDDFLRQWQKISAIYDIEINFIVKYSPENCDKDKLELNKIAARWPAKAVTQFFFS